MVRLASLIPNRLYLTITSIGEALIGLQYMPLFERPKSVNSFEVIHAPHVTSDSGTGLVHLAPAHGAEDYNVFRTHGFLSTSNPRSTLVCHVDGNGHFSPEVAEVVGKDDAISLVGRDVLYSGSKMILRLLKKLQRLVGTERITHKYPYDWRTKKPVIVT
jgi:isoleucyl-tRNA synthetase